MRPQSKSQPRRTSPEPDETADGAGPRRRRRRPAATRGPRAPGTPREHPASTRTTQTPGRPRLAVGQGPDGRRGAAPGRRGQPAGRLRSCWSPRTGPMELRVFAAARNEEHLGRRPPADRRRGGPPRRRPPPRSRAPTARALQLVVPAVGARRAARRRSSRWSSASPARAGCSARHDVRPPGRRCQPDGLLEQALRDVVVDRGSQPMPPGRGAAPDACRQAPSGPSPAVSPRRGLRAAAPDRTLGRMVQSNSGHQLRPARAPASTAGRATPARRPASCATTVEGRLLPDRGGRRTASASRSRARCAP